MNTTMQPTSLQVDKLVAQLAPPKTAPRASAPPDGSVTVSGNNIGTEYVLALPVSVKDSILKMAWDTKPSQVLLTSVDNQWGEQSLKLPKASNDATHHLVLLWARLRAPRLFEHKPYKLEVETHDHEPSLHPDALEAAVTRIWALSPIHWGRGLISIALTQALPSAQTKGIE
jgi:hypothetical protein